MSKGVLLLFPKVMPRVGEELVDEEAGTEPPNNAGKLVTLAGQVHS